LVHQFLPGLSSVATNVISGDIKATMKVRVAMVDLWQVALRNTFDAFEQKLVKLGEKAKDQKIKQMLLLAAPT